MTWRLLERAGSHNLHTRIHIHPIIHMAVQSDHLLQPTPSLQVEDKVEFYYFHPHQVYQVLQDMQDMQEV